MTAPLVSVIIVSYNTKETLRRCLESVRTRCADIAHEVLVVDNASADGSPAMVREDFPEAALIENAGNAGFAKANNQALRLMKGEYALLLNSDAFLRPGSVEAMLSCMDRHPGAAMVGPKLLDESGRTVPSTYPLPSPWKETLLALRAYLLLPAAINARIFLGSFFKHDRPAEAGRLTGACVLIRKRALEEIGPLDEDFFFYGEVHDWCWRAGKKGWKVLFCPGGEVVHLGGASSGASWPSEERLKINLREQERMLAKNLGTLSRWWIMSCRLFGTGTAALANALFRKGRPEARRAKAEFSWFLGRFYGTAAWILKKNRAARAFYSSGFHRGGTVRLLSGELGCDAALFRSYLDEAAVLARETERRLAEAAGRGARAGAMDLFGARLLYAAVRALRPVSAVETGVANGVSSLFILSAMERNGRGKLHSIDLPEAEGFIPAGREAGWLVEDGLRARWRLIIGDTRELLPALLSELGGTGLFLHDSAHTEENMLFEYRTAWPFLGSGGLLISDDTGFNRAFAGFASGTGRKPIIYSDRLGFLRK
jgi:GT2 family glycosyltransferase/predicted O-methyltransferase YrrM